MSILRTCEKLCGGLGQSRCVGKLFWIKWGKLELACPTACACLFEVRPCAICGVN